MKTTKQDITRKAVEPQLRFTQHDRVYQHGHASRNVFGSSSASALQNWIISNRGFSR